MSIKKPGTETIKNIIPKHIVKNATIKNIIDMINFWIASIYLEFVENLFNIPKYLDVEN